MTSPAVDPDMTFPGVTMPRSARGIAAPFHGATWRLCGRALSVRYRLGDPEEVRRYVPKLFDIDDDPVIGVRFWELAHDAGFGEGRATAAGGTVMREAVVAFPVSFGGCDGDNTACMYADEPIYTAFAREMMGWPVLPGEIAVSIPWPGGRPAAGARLGGALVRQGRTIVECEIELERLVDRDRLPTDPPVWLTEKVIPDVASGTAIHQIVRTGPSQVRWGDVWEGTGTLMFGPSSLDELEHLQPREILSAQYWSDIEIWLAPGKVLASVGTLP